MLSGQKTCVVINPVSGRGKMFKRWPQLETQLKTAIGEFDTFISQYPSHATILTREAINNGYERIIAVGGDGTLSQVANGFFSDDGYKKPLNENAVLGIISSGTGCDTVRTLDVGKDFNAQVETLRTGKATKIDLGQVQAKSKGGKSNIQLFINICSFGLSGDVVAAVNKGGGGKILSGRFAYLFAAMGALIKSKNKLVKMKIGDNSIEQTIAIVGVANGAFCGGGVNLAPMAHMNDAKLEAIVVGDVGLLDLIKYMKKLFKGEHLSHPKIDHYSLIKFSAQALNSDDEKVCVEADGEPIGYLPCEITIREKAIKVMLQK